MNVVCCWNVIIFTWCTVLFSFAGIIYFIIKTHCLHTVIGGKSVLYQTTSRVSPYTSWVLEPLPARFKTEQNTVGVSPFVKYEKLDSKLYWAQTSKIVYIMCNNSHGNNVISPPFYDNLFANVKMDDVTFILTV